MVLISGGNGSGKSRVAELIASQIERKRYYAATMIPWGEEGEARKAKHLKSRAGLGFITVECPYDLSEVDCSRDDLVLLEDLSNLLANGIFGARPPFGAKEVLSQVRDLESRCAVLLVVSIAGLTGEGCDEATRRYVDDLNGLNAELARGAGTVIEMHDGAARVLKGDCPWELA